MSNWMNEAGEPYMTAAQLAFEASLDEQSAYDRQFDDYYDDRGDFCYDCGGYIDQHSECDCEYDEDEADGAIDSAMEAGLFGGDC